MTRAQRFGNGLMSALIEVGVIPHSYLMTTRGRRSGRLRRTPVTLVEPDDGRRYLVAPYGPVSWVHNARAAGLVTLRRRSSVTAHRLRPVDPAEAGPILKQYLGIASATRPYFYAGRESPIDDFIAEAHLHPVFELLPRRSR